MPYPGYLSQVLYRSLERNVHIYMHNCCSVFGFKPHSGITTMASVSSAAPSDDGCDWEIVDASPKRKMPEAAAEARTQKRLKSTRPKKMPVQLLPTGSWKAEPGLMTSFAAELDHARERHLQQAEPCRVRGSKPIPLNIFAWDILTPSGWIVVNGIFTLPGWQGN